MGILLVTIGIVTTLVGVVLIVLERSGFRGLPGDILIEKGNVTFFFPIVTSIVVSILLSLLFSFFFRR